MICNGNINLFYISVLFLISYWLLKSTQRGIQLLELYYKITHNVLYVHTQSHGISLFDFYILHCSDIMHSLKIPEKYNFRGNCFLQKFLLQT